MELTRVGPTQSLFLTLRFMTARSQKPKLRVRQGQGNLNKERLDYMRHKSNTSN